MEINSDIWKVIIPAFFTLLGVIIGSILSYRNSFKLFKNQKKYDNRRIAYSRLLAYKYIWAQSVIFHLGTRFSAEYFYAKFNLLSDEKDLEQSNKQFDRASSLMRDTSIYQKEIFETIGLIQTCYIINPELELAINELFGAGTIQIQPFPKTLKNLNELNQYHDENSTKIPMMAEVKYVVRVDKLLKLLKVQLDSEK
ncbi:hypothetical protein [Flavobacterium bizetiae]|uniref:hypothetical protein n=1 Tax=Flavobacterium bizetiae TaxID=2704140 RepID=UPI00174B8019|nr:hypothetical protein [Flavobacterium bizetiae]CAD5343007.1 hypothetical protein FLA105535_03005 [Flavobacterium bizetiae]CAD5350462.1 hypothetical protein FLA105534_04452 [Flavobacterium bizetiae]